jgi:hypothetical protein
MNQCLGISTRESIVKISSVTFGYCTAEDCCKEMMRLKERFKKAQTLLST